MEDTILFFIVVIGMGTFLCYPVQHYSDMVMIATIRE